MGHTPRYGERSASSMACKITIHRRLVAVCVGGGVRVWVACGLAVGIVRPEPAARGGGGMIILSGPKSSEIFDCVNYAR